MEYNYETRYCFRFVPLHICCKLVVIGDIVYHLITCGFLVTLATFEMIFILFAIVQLMLAILPVLFFIGIIKESDTLMIPMIVAKIIMMLIVGTVTILTWISFTLSLFALIYIESPIKWLSPSTYLGLQSTAMTIFLIILIMESSVLHAGYKYFKEQINQRNVQKGLISFMKNSSLTMKPTFV